MKETLSGTLVIELQRTEIATRVLVGLLEGGRSIPGVPFAECAVYYADCLIACLEGRAQPPLPKRIPPPPVPNVGGDF